MHGLMTDELLELVRRAATAPAGMILEEFRSPRLQVDLKADGSVVTRCDRQAERLIRRARRRGRSVAVAGRGVRVGRIAGRGVTIAGCSIRSTAPWVHPRPADLRYAAGVRIPAAAARTWSVPFTCRPPPRPIRPEGPGRLVQWGAASASRRDAVLASASWRMYRPPISRGPGCRPASSG